ncbi:DUF6526 family protein [Psychrobacillus soli]|uniref:ABC transporter permease n=1 Tax=Psychrobacillus soli TaxID=1543965 RepID=A0A544T9S6_9BACI|nr:DUF6526 family protein [Psychrobacillus soli]TQR14212.1 hypothetical protein FG383_11200 [Psychrobacillus soli]
MQEKKLQTYENHTRLHPLQHFIFMPIGAITLLVAIIFTITSIVKDDFSFITFLIMALVIMSIIAGLLARMNALKVQDRTIRVEEQLRYFMLTGSPIDSHITMPQLIALRFASDDEFPGLVSKAALTGMTPDEIKKEIQQWRKDEHRV